MTSAHATKRFGDESVAFLRARGHVLKQRDDIILGLALKIDSAFRALLDDARVHRVEAAIAIPFVTKLAFECPSTHLDVLRDCITKVTKMLIIGWRGVEMHVLKLLRAILRGVPELIVSGSADGAEDVRTRLTGAGLPVDFATYDAGFSEFVVGPKACSFLIRK